MKVQDVMHKGATCVEPNTPIREIARQMRDRGIGAVPVKLDGKLMGMVTDRDITCRALTDGGDLSQMTAKDVMTKDIVCCSPADDIRDAVKAMEARQIRRRLVTNNQKAVVGMLSLSDISQKVSEKLSSHMLRAVSIHHA